MSILSRDRSYTRYQRNRAINRKFNILKNTWGSKEAESIYGGKKKGSLSKGKIHCSCWMCRKKSNIELSHSDKKKLISYKQALDEYFSE